MTMKIVLIEDQHLLRKSLKTQIENAHLGFEIVGEAESVSQGIGIITLRKPDIVFFDIEIVEGTSFEILDALENINFKSVFITAHGHFAIKAIKYSAFDFLLKPVEQGELIETLHKLKQEFKQVDDYKQKFEILFNELKGRSNSKIAIRSLDTIKYITTQSIVRIEADRSYCTLHLENGVKITSSKNMNHYEHLLPNAEFIKVHRSHIININKVDAVIKTEGGFIRLSNQDIIPISRRKKEDILNIIEEKLNRDF
jgi:two-component system LytT family response regulator